MKTKKRVLGFLLSLTILATLFAGTAPGLAAELSTEVGTMVVNGDFEADADNDGRPDFWTLIVPQGISADMTLEKETSKVYAGESSLKFTSSANTNNDAITVTESEFHQIDTSKVYIIEFFAKVPSGVVHLFADEKKAADGSTALKDMAVDAHQWAHAAQWTKFVKEYTPTEGTEAVRLTFYNWNEAALEAYIDNVVFREKSDIPIISFSQQDGTVIYGQDQQLFTISGSVSDDYNNLSSLKIDGTTDVPVNNGVFTIDRALSVGANTFTLTAVDAGGLTATASLTVTLEIGVPPVITFDAGIRNYAVVNEASFTLSGTVKDGDLISLTVNGEDALLIDVDSSTKTFSKNIMLNIGHNKLTVIAHDQIGLTAEKEIWIKYVPAGSKSDYDIGVFYFADWNPEFNPALIANNKAVYGRDNDWFAGMSDHLLKPGPWAYGPIPDREPLLGCPAPFLAMDMLMPCKRSSG